MNNVHVIQNTFKKYFRKKSFANNVFHLTIGNILAQSITIITIPIVTRLYSPEAFGLFALFSTIVSLFVSISSLRYNAAILLPSRKINADSVALLSLLIAFVISLFSAVVVAFLCLFAPGWLEIQIPSNFLWLAPLSVLAGGIAQVFNFWRLREKSFKLLSASKISTSVTNRCVNLGIGAQGVTGPFGLVLGHIAGQLTTILILLTGRKKCRPDRMFAKDRFKNLIPVAKRYKTFPLFAWTSFLEVLNRELPIIFLSVFFSPMIVGYYSLSKRILGQPMLFVGDAISRTFFQKASEVYSIEKENLTEISIRLLKYLTAFTLLPMALIAATASDTVPLVFGQKWIKASFYLQLLTPIFISNFLFRPISIVFDVLERQKERFILSIVLITTSSAYLIIGGIFKSPHLSVGLFSVGNMLVYLGAIIWLLSRISVPPKMSLRIMAINFLISCFFILPILASKWVFSFSDIFIIITAFIILVLYGIFRLSWDCSIRQQA